MSQQLEDLAFTILHPLFKRDGKEAFEKLDSKTWQEFDSLLEQQIKKQIGQYPVFKEGVLSNYQTDLRAGYRILGYITFVKRILPLPESLRWRRLVLGQELVPKALFWIIAEKLVPQMITDLANKPIKCLNAYDNLLGAINPTVSYPPQALISNYNQALTCLDITTLISEVPSNKDVKNILEQLWKAYKSSITNWACEYKLTNEKNCPLDWCTEYAEEKIKIWRKSVPMAEWGTEIEIVHTPFLSQAEHDFTFVNSGWHPDKLRYVSRDEAKKRITKAFEAELEQYLKSKDRYDEKLVKDIERDLHIIWLVRNRIQGDPATKFQKTYKKPDDKFYSKQAIHKGITEAAKNLGFPTNKWKKSKAKKAT